MVMRAIIEESDVETSKAMQMLALTQGTILYCIFEILDEQTRDESEIVQISKIFLGALLSHLEHALLTKGRDLRILTNRQLSGLLIGLWTVDNQPANDMLGRCLVSRNFRTVPAPSTTEVEIGFVA